MTINASAEEVILELLHRTGPCSLDDLVIQLPNLSWSKVFAAIDSMSRDGRVLLDRHPGSIYSVALPSQHASHHSPSRQKEPQPCFLSPHNFA
jgi:hypothetical protein